MKTWKQINRNRIKFIRLSQKFSKVQFNRISNDLRKEFQGSQNINSFIDIVNSYKIERSVFEDIWDYTYNRAGLDFAQSEFQDQKAWSPKMEKKSILDDLRKNTWSKMIQEFVESECGELITLSIKNEFEDIVNVAQKSVSIAGKQGLGAIDTMKLILGNYDRMHEFKAQRIARTEVMRASNQGSYIGAQESGRDLEKVWLATQDDRTRDGSESDYNHLDMDDVAVNRDEPFNVSGENMMFPGDPNGSAGNTINCRCAVSFRPKNF